MPFADMLLDLELKNVLTYLYKAGICQRLFCLFCGHIFQISGYIQSSVSWKKNKRNVNIVHQSLSAATKDWYRPQ